MGVIRLIIKWLHQKFNVEAAGAMLIYRINGYSVYKESLYILWVILNNSRCIRFTFLLFQYTGNVSFFKLSWLPES